MNVWKKDHSIPKVNALRIRVCLAGPKHILTDFKHDKEGKLAGPTLILPVGDRRPVLKALTVPNAQDLCLSCTNPSISSLVLFPVMMYAIKLKQNNFRNFCLSICKNCYISYLIKCWFNKILQWQISGYMSYRHFMCPVIALSIGPRTEAGKISVGPASFPSLSCLKSASDQNMNA